MEYLQLQGRFLGLFGSGHSSGGYVSKRKSLLVVIAVFLIHGALILLLLNQSLTHPKQSSERTLQLLKLLPDRQEKALEPQLPSLPDAHPIIVTPSTIQFSELKDSLLISSSPEFSNTPVGQYENVFDPKMREKLIDSQKINRARAQEKSRTWTAIDGRTYIEMGDGQCLVSMPKVDSRDRGTSWGFASCGKNDSEKAMDRVMADFESRKAPLEKLKSNP